MEIWTSPTYIVIDDFLPEQENRRMLGLALNNEHRFETSGVVQGDDKEGIDNDYRSSRLWHPDDAEMFYLCGLVRELADGWVGEAILGERYVGDIFEMGIVASNHGDRFRVHRDIGHRSTDHRRLTYVYYFNEEPEQFSGGALKVYHESLTGAEDGTGPYHLVAPRNNRIVFFASNTLHEVCEVRCPTKEFRHSRFTANGWLGTALDQNTEPAPEARPIEVPPVVTLDLARLLEATAP